MRCKRVRPNEKDAGPAPAVESQAPSAGFDLEKFFDNLLGKFCFIRFLLREQ
jgi:hypothetical protein